MIGLDTNILVRYIAQDDEGQAAIVNELVDSLSEDEPGFVSLVAIAELSWVLKRTFKPTRDEVAQAVFRLLSGREIVVQDAILVGDALRFYSQLNSEFSDCLISRCSEAAGCTTVVTFDRKAAKSGTMKLLR